MCLSGEGEEVCINAQRHTHALCAWLQGGEEKEFNICILQLQEVETPLYN